MQETQEENINKEQERLVSAINSSIENLMKTKEGRLFLLHLLDMTGVFTAFYDEKNLPIFEGRRTVGAELLSLLKGQDKNNLSKLLYEE